MGNELNELIRNVGLLWADIELRRLYGEIGLGVYPSDEELELQKLLSEAMDDLIKLSEEAC